MAPSTMRAWQFDTAKGGIEKNMKLNTVSVPQPKSDEHFVQVLYCALNPVDYKPAEAPFLGRFVVKAPATPGLDFAGRIVKPAAGSSLKPGQLVFGCTSAMAGGALREYSTAETKGVVAAPEGVSARDLATIWIAGQTAYQSIGSELNSGESIFINGGSGGTGMFGIQIAKAKGLKVTTSCSTTNVGLCTSLGADKVIDYKKQNIFQTLQSGGQQYSRIVDNVGGDFKFFSKAHECTKPGSGFSYVGWGPSLSKLSFGLRGMLLPGFLGGGKRKFEFFFANPTEDAAVQIAQWMREGKVKPIIDSEFAFEYAPEAYRRQKTGRARGKIVVNVAGDHSAQ